MPATSSVILVPYSKTNRIDEVIAKVNEIYREVNEALRREGFSSIGLPVIKKIPIVETQLISFRDLAERQLKERLDEKIEELVEMIQRIKEGLGEAKAKKIKHDLKGLRREMDSLEKIANELGIEASQFALIGQLINQAILLLEGGG